MQKPDIIEWYIFILCWALIPFALMKGDGAVLLVGLLFPPFYYFVLKDHRRPPK